MKKDTVLIKLGGELVADQSGLASLFSLIKNLQNDFRVVLVHGGGAQLNQWMDIMGVPIEKINGLRKTTKAGIEVATAVLAGLVNHALVRAASKQALLVTGLSLADLNLLRCESDPDSPLGFVGQVTGGDATTLDYLLDGGIVPIISCIGQNQDFDAVNVNADDAALALAKLLKVKYLAFLSSVPGVLDADNLLLPEITASDAERLISEKVIHGGMAVKIRAACQLASEGFCQVTITDIAGFCSRPFLLHYVAAQSQDSAVDKLQDSNSAVSATIITH